MKMLNRAIELAIEQQGEQTDKSGQPYIFHLLRVMLAVKEHGEEHMIVGVLHDLLEDTYFPAMYLPPRGYSDAVCRALNAITKRDDEPYDDYLLRVELNPIAKVVKLADLRDNLGRLEKLSEADQARLRPKYEAAIKRLGGELAAAPRTQGIEPRIESGNVQFDKDWPGVFFRGDLAINMARQLRQDTKDGKKIGFERIETLVNFLEDCHAELDHAVQHVHRAAQPQPAKTEMFWLGSCKHILNCKIVDCITCSSISELAKNATTSTQPAPRAPACPKCGSDDFNLGVNIHGEIFIVCLADDCDSGTYKPKQIADLAQFFTSIPAAQNDQLKAAQFALERDRTKVAECITAVRKELQGYDWLIEGRGCYEWSDDRWHDEFRKSSAAIYKAIEPMVKIAADWTNCPMNEQDVKAARAAIPAQKEEKNMKTELHLSGLSTDHIWLMEDGPENHPIGVRLDCGDSGVVYLSKTQAQQLGSDLLAFSAPTDEEKGSKQQ
jgi:hypothetical protein